MVSMGAIIGPMSAAPLPLKIACVGPVCAHDVAGCVMIPDVCRRLERRRADCVLKTGIPCQASERPDGWLTFRCFHGEADKPPGTILRGPLLYKVSITCEVVYASPDCELFSGAISTMPEQSGVLVHICRAVAVSSGAPFGVVATIAVGRKDLASASRCTCSAPVIMETVEENNIAASATTVTLAESLKTRLRTRLIRAGYAQLVPGRPDNTLHIAKNKIGATNSTQPDIHNSVAPNSAPRPVWEAAFSRRRDPTIVLAPSK